MKRSLWFLCAVAAAMSTHLVGCSSEDGQNRTKPSEPDTCKTHCTAVAQLDCLGFDEQKCEKECASKEEECPESLEALLACLETKGTLACGGALGMVVGCQKEQTAVQSCSKENPVHVGIVGSKPSISENPEKSSGGLRESDKLEMYGPLPVVGSKTTLPTGCTPSSLIAVCDPTTNKGCSAGEACDVDANTGRPACFGGANTQPEGAACDNLTGPYCAPTLHCDQLKGKTGKCGRLCCTDSDCHTPAICKAFDPGFGTLGVCGAP